MARSRLLVVLVTALVTVGVSLNAAAQAPVLEQILKNGEIRVGMTGTQPPYNAADRSGQLIGLEVDLARMLASALGVNVRFVTRPFAQLMPALESGEVDVVMSGMAITAERSVTASFVGPYLFSGKSILTNSRALAAAQEAGAFNHANLKLVALENSTSQRFVEKVLPEAQLTTTKDYDTAVNMVIDDEVDAMVADMPICVLAVMRYPDKGLATLNEPLNLEPVGLAVSPKDPQLHGLLESYVKAYEATGQLDALRKKWLEDSSWIASLP